MNELLIKCFAAGALGIFLHSLSKAQSLKKDAIAANMPWSIKKDYWAKDNLVIVSSFACVILWWLVFGEAIKVYPKIEEFIICSYTIVGALGSYAFQRFLGKAKPLIRNFVDTKTNQLDEILNNQKTEKMEEFEWALSYERDSDQVVQNLDLLSLSDFAASESGTVNATAKEIVFTSKPLWENQTFQRLDTTTYLSEPVRRPI